MATATQKFKLREIRKTNEALTQIENISGFDIKPSFKLSLLKVQMEKHLDPFYKTQEKVIMEKKKELDDVKGLKEGIDFVYAQIKNQYNVPILVQDLEEVDSKLGDLLDQEFEVEMHYFVLDDFTQEISEKDADSKKTVKKRVNLVTPGILKGLSPFITTKITETVES